VIGGYVQNRKEYNKLQTSATRREKEKEGKKEEESDQ